MAVNAGQHQVQDDQRRFNLPHQAQSFKAIGGDRNFEPGPFQVQAYQTGNLGVVVDDQNTVSGFG